MTKENVLPSLERPTQDKKESGALFAAYFVLGFVLSAGKVAGGLTPFGISFTAAAPKRYFPFAAAGAAAGCLVGGINAGCVRYLAGIALALLGCLAAAAFDLSRGPAFLMGCAVAADVAGGAVLYFSTGAVLSDYLMLAGEGVLCGAGTYFFYRSIHSGYRRLRFSAMSVYDACCIITAAGLVLMNLCYLHIGAVYPARVCAMLLILWAVRYAGERRALILACALGFSLSFAAKGAVFMMGALAFSALFASLFTGRYPFACGFAFLCSCGVFAVAAQSEMSLPFFCEACIAAAIFMLLPPAINQRIEPLFATPKEEAPDGSLRQNLVLKLRVASAALTAVSESVESVRERIHEMTRANNDYNRELLSEEEFLRREIVLEKTNQIRTVAADQFFSIADMLEDLAFEFDAAECFDLAAAGRIRRLLADFDVFAAQVSVVEDKYARVRAEVLTECDLSAVPLARLTEEIGKIAGRYFDAPRITRFKNETVLAFEERPCYALSVGFAQHSALGELCGDTVKVLPDGRGHSILIISDGMGKGSRAALDGAMGAGLIARLLTAGFGFDTALKVVNSALLVKSNDETLATLDIASVDLYTGKTELYKAGAPASYLMKNKKITKCELTSMPAGILRGVEFAKRTAVLGCDDSIVLMSDGICDLGDEWVQRTLQNVSTLGVQEAADAVLTRALQESKGKKTDDMSIIYAKLERN